MSMHSRHILWNMTRKCNFQCHYCYFPHDNSAVTETIPVETILTFLESKGGEWLVGMTGGEPFIYPDFVGICEALTQKHRIGVDTNLSVRSKITQFADRIDPKRVNDIYASLHIEERERKKGVGTFIDNYHTLKERGFNIIVNYVIHPTLIDKFIADKKYFAAHGVPLVPRPFKGRENGNKYPESYSAEAKAIFADYPEAGKKMVFNFKGVPCHGGHTFLRMEPDGTIFRCPGDRTILGNITGTVETETAPTPCKVERCPCQGVHYVIMEEGQKEFVEGMKHYVIGEMDKAAEAFARAFELDATMSNALNNLGVIAMQKGSPERALDAFEKARKLHPSIPLYGENTVRALLALGDKENAETLCNQLAASAETNAVCPATESKPMPDNQPELCDIVFPHECDGVKQTT